MSHATQSKVKIPQSQFGTLKSAFDKLGYHHNEDAKQARIYNGSTHRADLGIFSRVGVHSDVAVVVDAKDQTLGLVMDRMYHDPVLGQGDCNLMEEYSRQTANEYAASMGGTVTARIETTADGHRVLVQEIEVPTADMTVGQGLI